MKEIRATLVIVVSVLVALIKASDIQILPVLYYALVFLISMHGRVLFSKVKFYTMLANLVVCSHS